MQHIRESMSCETLFSTLGVKRKVLKKGFSLRVHHNVIKKTMLKTCTMTDIHIVNVKVFILSEKINVVYCK